MKISIRKSPKKGRCVYAARKIKKGELVESCHLILMSLEDVAGTLEGYVYQYSRNTAAVALGNGSLFNHSDEANCEFYFDYKKKMLLIRAMRTIEAGEEVTINYRYSPQDKQRFHIHS